MLHNDLHILPHMMQLNLPYISPYILLHNQVHILPYILPYILLHNLVHILPYIPPYILPLLFTTFIAIYCIDRID